MTESQGGPEKRSKPASHTHEMSSLLASAKQNCIAGNLIPCENHTGKGKKGPELRPRYQTPDLTEIFIANAGSRNTYIRIFLAEFFGTFILMVLGDGLVAQNVLSSGDSGNFVTGAFGCGFCVTLAILASAPVSGGHINPAYTLAIAVLGKMPWIQVPVYMIGQYLGSFTASAVVFATYYESLNAFDAACNVTRAVEGRCATAVIFSTYPKPYLSCLGGFVDQVVGTGLLVTLVIAIIDDRGPAVPSFLRPYFVGTVVGTIVAAFGLNCGAALNPARDLSPRIFTAMAGWGTTVFSLRNYGWFLVPVLGPHVGALLGSLLYTFCIGGHYKLQTVS